MSIVETAPIVSNHKLESDPERYILRPQRPPPPPPSSQAWPPGPRIEQTTITPERNETTSPLVGTPIEPIDNLEKNHPTLLMEFQRLFDNFDYESVREDILNRKMIECNFTTVLWRIFLHCLPRDSNQWEEMLDTSRQNYEKLVEQYTIDPYQMSHDDHEATNLNHPLSRDENSSWAQYFADEEQKGTITLDVRRTCPDISYFRNPRVIDLQLRILFTHTRRHHKTTPYRQGMHEILGIIIYAIHTETLKVNEYQDANELMKKIYDPEFLEHDAYALFEKIMDHLRQFYALSTNNAVIRKAVSAHNTNPIPFQKLKDAHIPANETARRMNAIIERLKDYDRQLHNKLEELKIEPTVYGIRWLRVLFGREIPFESIPNLWTVIFCFDEYFGFVDHFFVALLIEVGRIIGKQGEMPPSHFLQSLMRQNVVTNVEPVIRKALNLTREQPLPPPEELVIPPKSKAERSRQNSAEDEREDKVPTKVQRIPLTRATGLSFNRPIITQPQKQTPFPQTNFPDLQMDVTKKSPSNDILLSEASRQSSAYVALDSESDFLTGKVADQRYHDNVRLQKCCAHYMNRFIERLQKQIVDLRLPPEELHIQLSGLKQIANVLDQKITFDAQSLQALVDYKYTEDTVKTNNERTGELS